LICADDVNFWAIIKYNKREHRTLLAASGDVGLEINAEKTKYIDVSSSELRTEPGYKDS
jgi:hypothetical protein